MVGVYLCIGRSADGVKPDQLEAIIGIRPKPHELRWNIQKGGVPPCGRGL